MAEVLASLKKIGGNGEQYTETVLWTNSAPTSNFAGQTVTLSDNISDYKYIAVKWRDSTSVDQVGEIVFDSATFIAQASPPNFYNFPAMASSNQTYTRAVAYSSANQIQFGQCYRLGQTTSNNAYSIPTEILGINELAHQTVVGKYAVTDIQKITANTVPTFATRGKPLAIWFTFGNRSSAVMQAFTNVNPTTGEINNNEVYYAYYSGTSQLAQWTLTTNTFVVTDNSISTSASLSSSDRWGYIGYTYE